jgi:hypothetical protein
MFLFQLIKLIIELGICIRMAIGKVYLITTIETVTKRQRGIGLG